MSFPVPSRHRSACDRFLISCNSLSRFVVVEEVRVGAEAMSYSLQT